MLLSLEQVLSFSEEALVVFMNMGLPEGPYLDYKQALTNSSDKEMKREFLKDVTAFANAAGGHLFVGVREPQAGRSGEECILGIENGEALCNDLERLCTASIDPRISGLRIRAVPLKTGRSCLIVHVPPSLGRPHMVTHMGHRSFYVRHSESTFQMSTHEIREAVLTAATSEQRARNFVRDQLNANHRERGVKKPYLYFQAIPLITVSAPWDVLSPELEPIIRGDARRDKFQYYATLNSYAGIRPTISGARICDNEDDMTWECEVHRTGYASVFFRLTQNLTAKDQEIPIVHSGTCDVFRAFCHLLDELLKGTGSDVPYLIYGAMLNAGFVHMATQSTWRTVSRPYGKEEIIWPDHIRQTGESFMGIAEQISLELFHAFGYRKISN